MHTGRQINILRITGTGEHLSALCGEALNNALANAATPAGDHGGFVFQKVIHGKRACLSWLASSFVGGQYQAVKVMHAMFTQARTVRIDEVAAPRERRGAHAPLDALN